MHYTPKASLIRLLLMLCIVKSFKIQLYRVSHIKFTLSMDSNRNNDHHNAMPASSSTTSRTLTSDGNDLKLPSTDALGLPLKLNPVLTRRLRYVDEGQLNKTLSARLLPPEQLRKLFRRPVPTPSRKRYTVPQRDILIPDDGIADSKTKDPTAINNDTTDDTIAEMANESDASIPKRRRRRAKKPVSLAPVLEEIIARLNLYDEPDLNKRMQLFTGYCLYHNYAYRTALRYFQILRAYGVFGEYGDPNRTRLRLNPIAFVDRGRLHTRIVSQENFRKLIEYLLENFSQYTAPVLIAIFTGLRTAEILQFTTYTLFQLKQHLPVISIRRKQTIPLDVLQQRYPIVTEDDLPEIPIPPVHNLQNTKYAAEQQYKDATVDEKYANYWEPVYNKPLLEFINNLCLIYDKELQTLLDHQQNVRLFQFSPRTLAYRMRHLYFMATNVVAPHGFGIHSCRYLIAQSMTQDTDNIMAIQMFLQHRNLETTRQYIKADFTHMTETFNRITNLELSNVRANIKIPKSYDWTKYNSIQQNRYSRKN